MIWLSKQKLKLYSKENVKVRFLCHDVDIWTKVPIIVGIKFFHIYMLLTFSGKDYKWRMWWGQELKEKDLEDVHT